MKLSLVVIVLLAGGVGCFGQSTTNARKFSLPSGIVPSDYQSGILMAKLKPEFKSLAGAFNLGRSTSLPGVTIRPLAAPELTRQNRSARGPLAANQFAVDISLYVRISFSPDQNIEAKINELYTTGYFDLIEPEYTAKIDFIPNDPAVSSQYYLGLIKAYEAWDISQSDAGTVIAIVDSGGDLDHPDLASNIYTNPDEIPNNHIDDDLDGYIDNVHGWDFVGSDTLNVYIRDSIGDNDPNLKQKITAGDLSHGVWVAGCAAGTANNGFGIAGVGYKTKILFTKHSADNQKLGTVYRSYEGILYAAQTLASDNVSRKIINCSWGSSNRSQIAQDIIKHITLDLGCLVVAAGGNGATIDNNYPSSYDYVLSVAATDKNDVLATFSDYGPTIDVAAPGVAIYTTAYNNTFETISGTSFSSPITAGAAALVWSKNPTFTPIQVGEQLRVTADNIDAKNPSFKKQIGRGRINVQNALTQSMPSIRASAPALVDNLGNSAELGKEAFLVLSLTNYLKSSGAITLAATSKSPNIVFTKSEVQLGSLNTGATIRNTVNPLKLVINSATGPNSIVDIELSITDGVYTDFQTIQVFLNPTYINVDENTILTSIASTGRIGFDDPETEVNGKGFVVRDTPILFEMGLIMGTSSTNLFNNVRGTGSSFEQDFALASAIKKITPGIQTTSEISGAFFPSSFPSLLISYRSLVMKEKPNDKFVILEYTLTNNSTISIPNFRLGMFADWDISGSGAEDAADWDPVHKIGYVYPKKSIDLPHAGIQVLNTGGSAYAIDNDPKISGTPFGLYDGFTHDEKFATLSTFRQQAGQTSTLGNDVSDVVSASAFTIPAGGKVVIAFALHAANNLTELLASADAANILYNQIFNIPTPTVAVSETCYGGSANLTASGATKFRWYKNFTGGHPFDSLHTHISTSNLLRDSTIYVSNADGTYESLRTPVLIKLKANPTILSTSSSFCPGESITLSVATADSYAWSTGAITQSIAVNAVGNYSVTVKYNSINCTSTSSALAITSLAKPTASFTSTGDLVATHFIAFTDQSTNAISWAWDFGDGIKLKIQNPTHSYDTPNNYSVTLSIIGQNGCQDAVTKTLGVITGLEGSTPDSFRVYPNPAIDFLTIQVPSLTASTSVTLMNLQGQPVMSRQLAPDDHGSETLFIGNLSEGMYLIRIQTESQSLLNKIIIRH